MRGFQSSIFLLLVAMLSHTSLAFGQTSDVFIVTGDDVRAHAQSHCNSFVNSVTNDTLLCREVQASCVDNVLAEYEVAINAPDSNCAIMDSTLRTKCIDRRDFRRAMVNAAQTQNQVIQNACVVPVVDDPTDFLNAIAEQQCEILLANRGTTIRPAVCEAKLDSCVPDYILALNPTNRPVEQIDLSDNNMQDALRKVRQDMANTCSQASAEKDSNQTQDNLAQTITQPNATTGGCSLHSMPGSSSFCLGWIFLLLSLFAARRR